MKKYIAGRVSRNNYVTGIHMTLAYFNTDINDPKYGTWTAGAIFDEVENFKQMDNLAIATHILQSVGKDPAEFDFSPLTSIRLANSYLLEFETRDIKRIEALELAANRMEKGWGIADTISHFEDNGFYCGRGSNHIWVKWHALDDKRVAIITQLH